jgi:hypothetical protein
MRCVTAPAIHRVCRCRVKGLRDGTPAALAARLRGTYYTVLNGRPTPGQATIMPADLIKRCIAARDAKGDFPTIWKTVLHSHPLVANIPVQTVSEGRAQLEIRLTTDHRLIYDPDTNGYSLWPFPPR